VKRFIEWQECGCYDARAKTRNTRAGSGFKVEERRLRKKRL